MAIQPSDRARQIRGSSLLLVGRIFSLGLGFLAQVVTVRYLSKPDYGAFAYALSIATTISIFVLLGQNRVAMRFLPMHEEKGDHAALFGTMALSTISILVAGLLACGVVHGIGAIADVSEFADAQGFALLLTLIVLAPILALDNFVQDVVAAFASPRAIFWRRHVAGPLLKLAAIFSVIALAGGAWLLAWAHVIAGVLGLLLYLALLARVLESRGLRPGAAPRPLRMAWREIFAFSLPLVFTDGLAVLRITVAVLVLEAYGGASAVADLRAVFPVASLNLVAFQSLRLLFAPTAARLHARGEAEAIDRLYRSGVLWITLLTFPVLATCVVLGEPVSVILFGARYAGAGAVLAILACGEFLEAVAGLGKSALQVWSRVRFLAATSALSLGFGVGLQLWLVPEHGAVGAAIGVTASTALQALCVQLGLARLTSVRPFSSGTVLPLVGVFAILLVLVLARRFLSLPPLLLAALIPIVTLGLVRALRGQLDVEESFPRLAKLPIIRRVLGLSSDRPGKQDSQ